MNFELNCYDPTDSQRPHVKQAAFISSILGHTGDDILKIHGVAGRGGAKTVTTVLTAFAAALDDPGSVGLVTAPTYDALGAIWVSAWEEIVPRELYTYADGGKLGRRITLFNGTNILLRSRHINNPRRGRDATRGININWWLDDESAIGFDKEFYTNTLACIRRVGKRRFAACITTPVLGPYYDLVHSDGHLCHHWTSADNPHLPSNWVNEISQQMSQRQLEREILGQWVALEGLVWRSWSDEDWPNGNVYRQNISSRGYYLFLDLGVGNGAYVIVKCIPGVSVGRNSPLDNLWVATAELMPVHDGSASRALALIKRQFGVPQMIVSGADMTTRSSADAKTPLYFARSIFGGVPVKSISGWQADKQIQYDMLDYLIRSHDGVRRFCVHSNFVSLEQEAKRGVKELVKQDSWPDNAGKVRGVFFQKEGRLEHVRDALLYGAVGVMSPPMHIPTGRHG